MLIRQVVRMALLPLCLLTLVLAGEAQTSTGTILGTVKDSSGAVLPSADVTIFDVDTGISRSTKSDTNGHYSAASLSLGHYRVTCALQGFNVVVRDGIQLTVGREEIVDFSLVPGTVSQTVT